MEEKIYYKSTRGGQNGISASEAILKGIAEDGGLFVPSRIPKIDLKLKELASMNYRELAYYVLSKFLVDFTEEELKNCVNNAYDNKFDTEEIAPMVKVGDSYFLELFHGPTLAFKDMALSILPYLLTTSSKKQGLGKEIVILTATSGDTGKAALEGFTNIPGIKIIVFYPEEGVSEIQKMQMITHKGNNTHVIGIKGNFDDAQSGVKRIFRDEEFLKTLEENNYVFSSANSINIGRLVPQVVYYFYAYLKLYSKGEIAEDESINVVVPTGNFGNILAAYYAKEMGLPINKLICASNDNKVLYDFISTGVYDKGREFYTTISPSMDILISSNLERLLYALSGEDSKMVKELMDSLDSNGSYKINDAMRSNLKDFFGGYASEEETKKAISDLYNKDKYIMDTHTAVAYSVNERYVKVSEDNTKAVVVSTASPYKFTYAVMNSIDNKYADYNDFQLVKEMSSLLNKEEPLAIKDINKREIVHKTVCNKEDMKKAVQEYLNF
ncbi:threonine synthase [Clostridium homopropionicum DSM 5847]|uniref:Threonine synthase n=1 Tax=Clostridium homopropionicum DSM 5847 TaxID=1121318 RepID=A0A0L6ZBW2_9CLOT|nr:threonine synthase [Clostridium homopropionicum]KOA20273.1 threonine synthase [Clostridium homopropionicum DSM 5847]SFG80195.1 threonine synthase [Clostridium homopropionicum]